MDTQLSMFKKLNYGTHDLIYNHNGETIIYCQITDSDGTERIVEIRQGYSDDNGHMTKTKRFVPENAMSIDKFRRFKNIIKKHAKDTLQREKQQTYRNVSLDLIGEGCNVFCKSAEDEYFDNHTEEDDAAKHTFADAMAVLDACLTETQKRRYLMSRMDGMTITEISEAESRDYTSVLESLRATEERIVKFTKSS